MRKIAIILIVFFFVSCSVLKRESDVNVFPENSGNVPNSIERIRKQNISNQSFYISKAEIEIVSEEDKQHFIGSIKYSFPDTYLISLRSKSGIEGARVFVTKDTLIVNDRINRKLYYGKPDYLKRKLGISTACFPLIFGDFLLKNVIDSVNVECSKGFMNLNGAIKGIRYESIADCRKAKLVSCIQSSDNDTEQLRLMYGKFLLVGTILVPSNISLIFKDYKILIKFKKLEIPWEGKINFIPGSNYEVIPLR